jgi:sulfite exporter TauE/SafE
MIELPLVFLGGLLGSSHCVGMCGGFAVMIGVAHREWKRNLAAQVAYSSGRIMTYCVLGAAAGQIGLRLEQTLGAWMNVPALLCVIAGLFLIVEGLAAAGLDLRKWRRTSAGRATGPCTMIPLMASVLRAPGARYAFAAGLLTSLIPCGLVYAFLSLAATSGNFASGMLIMGVFGLGTVPLMLLTGATASMLTLVQRRRMMYVAAWCVVLTGVITVARGAGVLNLHEAGQGVTCPFCSNTRAPTELRP